MTFDRLLYIDRLKGAGIDETVARAHAEALRDALMETVATKADLQELAARLEQKIDGLDKKIDSQSTRLDNKIDAQGTRLENKIEITARDLVIKGASALVILVSLMIGLKMFG